jgi:DNA replication protein DnaC
MTETNRLFRQADMPERYKWKFIDDFHIVAPDGTPIQLADTAHRSIHGLVDATAEPKRGYLFYGNPGTGKTLLGCIAINELMLRWTKPGRFLNLSRKYFQKLKDTFSEDSANYGQTWQILEELCNMPYLILDDFGIQRGTEWEMEMLYNLVDARYGDERFTVVTTNQPLEEIKNLSQGRIYSRLVEMCHLIPMDGPDYRMHLQ